MDARWSVLFIVCFAMFGLYYCYDNPVALQNQLHSIYGLDEVKYALLYSVYAFPNAILPFFSGILTDIFGVNSMILIFFGFIMLGHGLFTIGSIVSNNNFLIMIIGRILLGVGAESFALALTPLCYQYFKNKELAFALALLLSSARIGSFINDYLTYYIYTQTDNITLAISTGFWILMLCLILLLALICYRIYFAKHQLILCHSQSLPESLLQESSSEFIEICDPKHEKNISNYKRSLNSIISNDGFHLNDIMQFDSCYWLLTLNCGISYGCFYGLMNIGSDFLQHTFNLSNGKANILLMIPYIIGSVATMCIGYLSDIIGKRGYMLFVASILLVIGHSVFIGCILNKHNDIYYVILALVTLGLEFSIFCAVIWPSFVFLVNEKYLGTAYGVPMSLYNAVNAVFYIIVGMLTNGHYVDHEIRDKYLNAEYFLLGASLCSVCSVSLLLYMDSKTGHRLNMPSIT